MKEFKIILISLFIFISSLIVGGGLFLIHISYKDLPDVSGLVENYDPITPTLILDSKENIIDRIFVENRELVKIEEVPINLINAVLAIEDRRFMKHFGFDYIRFTKSVITAPLYILRGRNVHGGSTITQQLSRNAFLTHERKLTRKIKELIIAIEIERRYTKEEILEKYLNEIYFGSGAYGIQTASKTFYGKDVSTLNIAESALLVGVPNRPNSYSPMNNLGNAIRRKNIIVGQMYKYNFISEEEFQKARAHKFIYEDEASEEEKSSSNVTLVKRKIEVRRGDVAPEFVDIVRKEIEKNFDDKDIYEGGLKIYTTLDLAMQKEAEDALRNSKAFNSDSKLDGSIVTIDSQTGYVKSMVGGRNYKSGDFNRATMALRQPGSSFKPFIFFSAIDKDYPMNLVLEDSRINYGGWKPNNYGGVFRNNITMLESLERSINISAIKLLQNIGLRNLMNNFSKMKLNVNIPNNLTTALGTMVITPFDLTKAYMPFSNGGYMVEPIYITKVINKYGQIVLENKITKNKTYETKSIAKANFMMQNVVKLGSGRNSKVNYQNLAGQTISLAQGGKTGTTNEWRSAWYAGFTPDLVSVIYLGYDNNAPTEPNLTGGGAAAPIWKDFYDRIISKKIYEPSRNFEFLEDLIKDKVLIKEVLDSRTGVIKDDSTYITREFLLERSQLPVESSSRYRKGIRYFFEKESYSENLQETEIGTEESNLTKEKEEERSQEIEDILNKLFGNEEF